MAISLQRVIRSTLCLVLWWGFRGRRIERRYLRFEQIQYGGHRHVAKTSSGHAIGRPIHFMFGYRVGFSVTADPMALFLIRTNARWRPPPSLIIWNDHTSATATYSAHRAVVFAIAQLSCSVNSCIGEAMLSLSDDYWPYSYCSSEVYVHKRGSNVRYIRKRNVAATFIHVDSTRSRPIISTYIPRICHVYVYRSLVARSVGIDLKELGGQLPKCLKFCPGIEV